MYQDKMFVKSVISIAYKFLVALGIFSGLIQMLIIIPLITGIIFKIYLGEIAYVSFIILILLIMNIIYIALFRRYTRTVIDIEVKEDSILIKCYKAIYNLPREQRIVLGETFFIGDPILNFKLGNGKKIKLYGLRYKQKRFARVENIDYSLLNMITVR